jgi:hypothetical protein
VGASLNPGIYRFGADGKPGYDPRADWEDWATPGSDPSAQAGPYGTGEIQRIWPISPVLLLSVAFKRQIQTSQGTPSTPDAGSPQPTGRAYSTHKKPGRAKNVENHPNGYCNHLGASLCLILGIWNIWRRRNGGHSDRGRPRSWGPRPVVGRSPVELIRSTRRGRGAAHVCRASMRKFIRVAIMARRWERRSLV